MGRDSSSGGRGGGDRNGWSQSGKIMRKDHKEPLLYFDSNGRPMSQRPFVAQTIVAQGNDGKFRVIIDAGDGDRTEPVEFETRGAAMRYANAHVNSIPDATSMGLSGHYATAASYIRATGKPMTSKYSGKDIYGNNFNAGDAIIYSPRGIVIQ